MQKIVKNATQQAIEIAPSFTCADWQTLKDKLDLHGAWEPCPAEWEIAISVLQNRVKRRFFDSVQALQSLPYSGFAVMALDCLLLESIQAFRAGKHAKTPKESRTAYKSLLLNS